MIEKRAMNRRKWVSPFIRVLSGIIGMLGFAAIAFNASQNGGIKLNLMLFASIVSGYIFLYVAFFGTYPWHRKSTDDVEH
ncbi:MAG: hypothetical protein WB812_06195 [Woeseiaceae bacterium]